jgi:hypothetical protein
MADPGPRAAIRGPPQGRSIPLIDVDVGGGERSANIVSPVQALHYAF